VGTANVLEAARRFDAKRIVFISSTAITNYGHIDPSGFLRTGSVYASTKLACEDLGLNYMHEYGNEFIALRLSAVISPWKYGGCGKPTQRFKELLERIIKGKKVRFPKSP